jgi:hypothetical protein
MRQLENSPKHVACYEIWVACDRITQACDELTPMPGAVFNVPPETVGALPKGALARAGGNSIGRSKSTTEGGLTDPAMRQPERCAVARVRSLRGVIRPHLTRPRFLLVMPFH